MPKFNCTPEEVLKS